MKDQTICFDDCECVYCGHKFDGREATNANMDCAGVTCPNCKGEMFVHLSIEYMCTPVQD